MKYHLLPFPCEWDQVIAEIILDGACSMAEIKSRGCTQEFSCAKKKEEFWFHVHKKRGTKLREPAEPHPMFTPVVNRRFFIRPPQQKLPLAILLSPHY